MSRSRRFPHTFFTLLLAVASVAHAADDAATTRAVGRWHGSLLAARAGHKGRVRDGRRRR
jgi:hypothetical protein